MGREFGEIDALRGELRPWVDFVRAIDGAEVGDQWTALERAADASVSANDYETAGVVLDRLAADVELLKRWRETWWITSIEIAEEDRPGTIETLEALVETGKLVWPRTHPIERVSREDLRRGLRAIGADGRLVDDFVDAVKG